MLMRGMVGRLAERDWAKTMPEIDRLVAEEQAPGGAASDPVGAGGAAVI